MKPLSQLILLLAFSSSSIAQIDVPFERIVNADKEPGNWLTYSRDFTGQRFSPLDRINASNVDKLHIAWIYQAREPDPFEASPIVVDGTMFITDPGGGGMSALDTITGRPLWHYSRPVASDLRMCCGRVNRGAAILNGLVFFTTIDAHIIALDARTGTLRWERLMADYKKGYTATAAPLAVHDKIIAGIAGGEWGVDGFLDAYDAKTGNLAWRFHSVPKSGEPGNETWAGDSWKSGSASTWVTGVYDPETDSILWGTGNPGPDYNGDVRKGDNLFSDSMIAIDPATGAKKWYFQYTPHDTNDWDSTQTPALANVTIKGQPRKIVALANRNGFYYALDRTNGKFIDGRAYIHQTWASGLDEAGRPIRLPDTLPTEEGKLIWPSLGGGSNWYSSTFSPQTGLYYVNVEERAGIFKKGEAIYSPGAHFSGGGTRAYRDEEPFGAVRALEAASGKLRWEYKLFSPARAGLMSTAGGLVFGSSGTSFFALDAARGELLWRFETGGDIRANPISYMSEGRQFVAVCSGHALMVFSVD
jgi:alcohol dehydrogenase (cytochrome c)